MVAASGAGASGSPSARARRDSPVSGSTTASTTMVEPSPKSPRRMPCARTVSSECWSARFTGRAPYAGSYPAAARWANAASVRRRPIFLDVRRSRTRCTWMRTMLSIWSSPSGEKTINSSTRLTNSGRKLARTAPSTCSLAAAPTSGLTRNCDPMLDVMMMIALRKLTTRPCESVTRPSSRIWSRMLNTSLCAFSISSKSTTA
mmetsp:Transcript_9329/g.30795  ORF Transcript_9329/g.30795 Transcript_9329/m.30795 type:complete len:203 (+) Transcript_9329:55-663(+)